ncbi:hypothetical protein SGPA1_20879 [Streptomyces misionensis JCM 4497]
MVCRSSPSWPYVLRRRARALLPRCEPLASNRRRERTVSGLFGEHDPVLGQGALPPLAGRGVRGGAQIDEGGGEGAAGVVQGAGRRVRFGEQPGGVLAGAFRRGQRVFQAVARAPVGDGDRRDEADQRADEGVHDPVGGQRGRVLEAGELGDEQCHGGDADAAQPVVAADQRLRAEVEGDAAQDERHGVEVGERGEHGEGEDADEVADDALDAPVPGEGDVGLVEGSRGDQGPVGAAHAEGEGGVAGEGAADRGARGDGGERREAVAQRGARLGPLGVHAEEFPGVLARDVEAEGAPAAAQLACPGAQPCGVGVGGGGEGNLSAHEEPFQGAPGGVLAGARGQQRLPGGVDGGGARGPRPGMAVAGAVGVGVGGGGVQGLSGGAALGAVRAQQSGRHADQPGPGAGGEGQSDVTRHLAEGLRGEQGGGADEGEDHVGRRADPGGVAQGLLDGRQQRADGHEDDGVGGEGRGDQGRRDTGDHAEHHPDQDPGAGRVGAVVGVEGAQRSGHRVHREVESPERQQDQVGRGDRGDHAQRGLEPDVRGPAEAEHPGEGKTEGGRTAHASNLACVLSVKHMSCPGPFLSGSGPAPARAPRVHPCARMRPARPGHRILDRTSSRGGGRARTGFGCLAAGRAVRGDRGLLPAAAAQRRRGAAALRGRRGADGFRHGGDGRAGGGVHTAAVGLAGVRGRLRSRGAARAVGGPPRPAPPAPSGGRDGDGLHGGGDGRGPAGRAPHGRHGRHGRHGDGRHVRWRRGAPGDRCPAALLHGLCAADRRPSGACRRHRGRCRTRALGRPPGTGARLPVVDGDRHDRDAAGDVTCAGGALTASLRREGPYRRAAPRS